jgi:hypothetical protein
MGPILPDRLGHHVAGFGRDKILGNQLFSEAQEGRQHEKKKRDGC